MQLLQVYIFLIPLVVLVLTEIVKVLVEGFRGATWYTGFSRPGGMPSTHSAFVTSLLIVVWRKIGLESAEFAIAFSLACIVWYDAVMTRRVLEEQSKLLNRMQHLKKFAEDVGHSFLEVFAGMVFGALITWAGIWLSNQTFGCGVFQPFVWMLGEC